MLIEDKSPSSFPTSALLSPDRQPYSNLPCEQDGEECESSRHVHPSFATTTLLIPMKPQRLSDYKYDVCMSRVGVYTE